MIGKKIAIVGGHGTGKTTLVHLLAAELKSKHHINVGVTRESARSSPYLIAGELVPETEINLLGRQLVEESEACRSHELVICDRSIMEIMMYSRLFFPNPSDERHKDYFAAIEHFGRLYAASYDAIFRMTKLHDISLTNDPLRPTDPELQLKAHTMLKELLDELGVQYHDVPNSDEVLFIIKKLEEKGI